MWRRSQQALAMSSIRSNTRSGLRSMQRLRRRIAPGHRAAGDADRARGLDVAGLVADRDGRVGVDAGALQHAAEFRRPCRISTPHSRNRQTTRRRLPSFSRALASVSDDTSASRMPLAASVPSMASTPANSGMLAACSVFSRRMCRAMNGSFHSGTSRRSQDLAGRGMAQRLDLLFGDPAKADSGRRPRSNCAGTREAVGQRAVEIEDDEGIGHSAAGDASSASLRQPRRKSQA